MPTLRERREDIPQLVEAALRRICGDQLPELSPEAFKALVGYSYPGNVRELENILERATALCVDGKITPEDLQLTATENVRAEEHCEQCMNAGTLDDHLGRLEKQVILDTLTKTGFNRTAAAKLLGVSFRSLCYRLERLGIDKGSAS